MRQSFTEMEKMLTKMYSAKEEKEMSHDFILEHGLKKGNSSEKCTYPEALTERLKHRPILVFTEESLKIRLNNALDVPQAFRRAATNPNRKEEFLNLSHYRNILDNPDANKGYTALHHPVMRGLPY